MKNTFLIIIISISFILLTSTGQNENAGLEVPYFAQGKDTVWADQPFGVDSTVTIRTHGCALTCISMVFSYHEGEKLTPPEMNLWLVENDGFEEGWSGGGYLGRVVLKWPALTGYGAGWVYTRHDWKAQPADLLLIKYYLDAGVPVIAEVTYKSAPHFVVLTGYDERELYMNDPEFPEVHNFSDQYNISDSWGSGPSRNINGVRVLYPKELIGR